MTKSTLPLDVFFHIAEELEDDRTALRHIALTNRSLLSCARCSLYSSITLSGTRGLLRAERLSRTLRAEPKLGALVKSLRISRLMRQDRYDSGYSYGVPLTPDLLPFHLLPNLITLNLHSLPLKKGPQGFVDLVTVAGSLPRLEALLCDDVMQDVPEPESDMHMHLGVGPSRLPVLRELVVKDGAWAHWTLAMYLLLNHRSSIDQLERITVSFPSRASADGLAWIPLIRTAGPHLRVVNIAITDASVRVRHGRACSSTIKAELDAYRNDHLYVMDNLSRLPALQTLQLKYYPDPSLQTGPAQSDGPIEALCEVLEHPSPPWPRLERLELWLVDQDGTMAALSDALCTRLARVITDKTRYPRFATLALRVSAQCWNASAAVWYMTPMSSKPERLAVVERWKRAFGAVEREPGGAVLDVAVLHVSNHRGW
ncbi:hypothetical protein C8Q73DRAFT_796204 [Cubamyces lactineus]|nr:hypothetical protein C8Q73DRAFT_796204 [Cubamyces lactineus]